MAVGLAGSRLPADSFDPTDTLSAVRGFGVHHPSTDQVIKMEDLLWAASEELKKKEGGAQAASGGGMLSHLYT